MPVSGWRNEIVGDALDAVERDVDKVSGVWVFQGTRVPVAALLRISAMEQRSGIPWWFPGVQRDQVESVLNHEIELATVVSE
jgi:uncharacterized protein (DUF433 family)